MAAAMRFHLSLLSILGSHLACFSECLGTVKIEPEYDFHTWNLLFSGPIYRPEFAADIFKIVFDF